MKFDPETVATIVFLASPAFMAASTMLLANRGRARGGWFAVLLTSLIALALAFPVGFTVVGPFVTSPSEILLALILFGVFVGVLGHKVTQRAAHG